MSAAGLTSFLAVTCHGEAFSEDGLPQGKRKFFIGVNLCHLWTIICFLLFSKYQRKTSHFSTLWDYAATENKRFLLSLCTRFSDGPDLVTIYLLEEKLAQDQIHLDREDLSNDIDFLLELELLGRDASRPQAVYRINIPLLAMWIKKHIDHAEQRNRAIRELKEQA